MTSEVVSINPFELLSEKEVVSEAPASVKTTKPSAEKAAIPAEKQTLADKKNQAPRTPRHKQQFASQDGTNNGPRRNKVFPAGSERKPSSVTGETGAEESSAFSDDKLNFRRRSNAPASRPRRTDFDRHSRTGKSESENKQFAGRGGWGKPIDAETIEAAKSENVSEVAVAGETGVETEGAAEAAASQKPAFKTLEQFMQEKKLEQEQLNAVKPMGRQAAVANDATSSLTGKVAFAREDPTFITPATKSVAVKSSAVKKTAIPLNLNQLSAALGVSGKAADATYKKSSVKTQGNRNSQTSSNAKVNPSDATAFPSL